MSRYKRVKFISFNSPRVRIVNIIILFVVPGIIILKLFYLQIWCHNEYLPKIKQQLFSNLNITFPRGNIYDRNFKLLATTLEYEDIKVSSKEFLEGIKTHPENLELVCKLLNFSPEEIINRCSSERYFILKKCVEISLSKKLWNLRGLEFSRNIKRCYPQGDLSRYILGITKNENGKLYGASGIELSLDEFLNRNDNIQIPIFRNGNLYKRAIRLLKNTEITKIENKNQNFSVVLTIDSKLQYKVEKILEKYYSIFSPKMITCIIQEPQTGEILCLAIYPQEKLPLSNPVVNTVFEPGSIFKVFPVAIFLNENVVTENTVFYCENGKFYYAGNEISDVRPNGNLTMKDIIVYSSNIGMAKAYLSFNNVEKYYSYLKLFGFSSPTGIELPGELRGWMINYHREKWSKYQPVAMSFGQGIAVTMLQIVNGYSMIANNGYLVHPRIVKYIVDNSGNIVYRSEKTVIRKPLSDKTISVIKEMLEETVLRGSAVGTKIDGIKICAKTGTAQKYDNKLCRYSPNKYIMSVCGFFPKEDSRYTIGVFVDEPSKGRLASQVAVPIFKDIVLELLNLNLFDDIKYAKMY